MTSLGADNAVSRLVINHRSGHWPDKRANDWQIVHRSDSAPYRMRPIGDRLPIHPRLPRPQPRAAGQCRKLNSDDFHGGLLAIVETLPEPWR